MSTGLTHLAGMDSVTSLSSFHHTRDLDAERTAQHCPWWPWTSIHYKLIFTSTFCTQQMVLSFRWRLLHYWTWRHGMFALLMLLMVRPSAPSVTVVFWFVRFVFLADLIFW